MSSEIEPPELTPSVASRDPVFGVIKGVAIAAVIIIGLVILLGVLSALGVDDY